MIPEHPPPSYLDRDIDVVSMRSAAPSYTSSLPPTYQPRSYSSLIPPTTDPGPIPAHHAYNVASWPSLSNQSRAFLNVAARRRAREEDADLVRRALRIGEGSSSASPSASGGGGGGGGGESSNTSDNNNNNNNTAMSRARFDEALRVEGRSWDFFTAQISDWEHRAASWKAFQARHDRTVGKGKGKGKGKGPRWGLYGRLG